MPEEFYRATFRKKIYTSLEQLQADADECLNFYNQERCYIGSYCYGKTPLQTFLYSRQMAQEKQLGQPPEGMILLGWHRVIFV
jgi:hypothetical protein